MKKESALIVFLLFYLISMTNNLFSYDKRIRIIDEDAVVRLKPNSESIIVRQLQLGVELESEGVVADWVKVILLPDKDGIRITGYVHKSEVEFLTEKRLHISNDIKTTNKEEVPVEKKSRFNFELFGGFSSINPSDLNSRVDFEESFLNFYYDDRYTYSSLGDYLVSWDKNVNGEFKKIKNTFPIGFRFKINVTENLSFSLGFRYFSKSESSTVSASYQSTWHDRKYFYDIEKIDYSPYTLFVKGYSPLIGIHYGFGWNRIGIEGYFTGGLLIAECGFSGEKKYQYTTNDYWSELQGSIEEKGYGTGITLDIGLRLNCKIISNTTLFVEGGYLYQRIRNLNGPGSQKNTWINSLGVSGSTSENWEGDWGIKESIENNVWGYETFNYPSNFWEELPSGQRKLRDFLLDLSGLQLRFGISFGF